MFGADYEELENCGVDFDPTCLNSGIYEEDLGECEEDDEKCLARYLLQRKKVSVANSRVSKNGSRAFGGTDREGRLDADAVSRKMSARTAALSTTLPPPTPEPLFEGLSKNYYKKNFRPDYPEDLQMKQVCTSKPLRRRTLGITRTQPKAVFTPSRTTFDKLGLKNLPVSPATGGGRKSVAVSSFRTSIPRSDSQYDGFSLSDSSPLEENRLPPPVVSSSDEVVVDWIESHNVQMMFEYFLGLCVISQPSDPWTFISELCAKMMEARTDFTAFDNLPRILTPEHTEAIFRIFDRIENGYITVPQYKAAMDAMGLNRYSTNPEGWEENAISKDTFVKEATEAIDGLLRTFMTFEQPPMEEQRASYMDVGKTKPAINVKKPSYSGSGSSSSAGQYSYSRSDTGSGSDNRENSPGETAEPQPPLQLQF